MDGAGDHEGGGPGRLPEHLSGDHVRDGTCTDPAEAVSHKPNGRDAPSLSFGLGEDAHVSNKPDEIISIYHYMSGRI